MKLYEIKLLEAKLEATSLADVFGTNKLFACVWRKKGPFKLPSKPVFGVAFHERFTNSKAFDKTVDALYKDHPTTKFSSYGTDYSVYIDLGIEAHSVQLFKTEKEADKAAAQANNSDTMAMSVVPVTVDSDAGPEWFATRAPRNITKPSGVPKATKKSVYDKGDHVRLTPMDGETEYERAEIISYSKPHDTYIVQVHGEDDITEVPGDQIYGIA